MKTAKSSFVKQEVLAIAVMYLVVVYLCDFFLMQLKFEILQKQNNNL